MRIPWSERDITLLLQIGDCLIVLVAGLLAYYTRFFPFGEHHPGLELYAVMTGMVFAPGVFRPFGLYDVNLMISASRVIAAWATVILLILALLFLTHTAQATSRLLVILWFIYGSFGLLAGRSLFRWQIDRWRRMGDLTRNVAIFGAGDLGRRLAHQIRQLNGGGVRLIGIFDDRNTRDRARVSDVPVRGTLKDLVRLARTSKVDHVIVTLPAQAEQRLLGVLHRLRDVPVDVALCPAVFEQHSLTCQRVTLADGIPLLDLLQKPFSRWGYLTKELEDCVLATVLLFAMAPVMLVIAAAVRLDSGGPIIFRQRRYGFNNDTIEIYKFRTMRAAPIGNERDRAIQARRDDPRLTRVGSWLRKTSLDELPQLFNVVRGDMSIVGPRPHMVEHNKEYSALIDSYLARHRVKPGITGWAQVNGWRGETDTLDKMEQRVQHDLHYIENWSLTLDLRILMRTLLVVLARKNAY